MKQLYASSYPFWVTSRALLIIVGLADLWRICIHYHNFINTDLLLVLFVIVSSIIFYGEIKKSKPNMILKYIAGLAALGLGLFIVYYKLSEPEDEWLRAMNYNKFDYKKVLVYIFAAWLILFGLFDFFKFDIDSEN
ncbi:hypothetical protein [Flavobacterium sp. KJJ]|uniref:hypothetical protein n=1 Tax=Flavobacterium sp. KJJ TaxID=1270193 RepID=UPI000493769F|nr:hypothetical protein [Flavobacterium sp. KJJ]